MNIILMGAPGAGKGTQADLFVKKYNVVHISTGVLFRQAMKDETPLGLIAKGYVDMGKLVPDEVTIGLVKERISQPDCLNGVLLDGFPRTIAQADYLDKLLHELNRKLDHVIYIQVPEEELIKRLTGRRMCKKCSTTYHVHLNPSKFEGQCDVCGGELYIREDDSLEKVSVRLNAYDTQTKPLTEYYANRKQLITVDGKQLIEEVFADILKKLGE